MRAATHRFGHDVSECSLPRCWSVLSIPDEIIACRAARLGVPVGANGKELANSIHEIKMHGCNGW